MKLSPKLLTTATPHTTKNAEKSNMYQLRCLVLNRMYLIMVASNAEANHTQHDPYNI